ncbi:VENN motif pre-toxin domain-containing protein [Erwinia sp. BC051422]|uniref:VENN motif pre-toxin domain-containing protein n=1 Tax=Erwinia wuhanensis TaxID=3045167 RepID=UPI002652B01F|nr:VENN motif pre-toxin domain-containing protein [Erwinia sp. BC051422]MDN8540683.1 VENN motif pre-toxin domain-containing protein [Erwinia sp. BC051422]
MVNVQANLIAHAVVGAVTSYASGNPALAGASGAAMGEYIVQQRYPGVKREDLGEEQRQTISALGTLAADLAGGLAGDSTGGAITGAQAGKNAVENNELFNLPSGLNNYGLVQGSLMTNTDNQVDENGKALPGMTLQDKAALSADMAKGNLTAGQNPAVRIVNGLGGAGMTTFLAPVLLPATATAEAVMGAGAIGGTANVFNQLSSGEPFSATDALIATGVSYLRRVKDSGSLKQRALPVRMREPGCRVKIL